MGNANHINDVSRTTQQQLPLWLWVGTSTLAHICLLLSVQVDDASAPIQNKRDAIEITVDLQSDPIATTSLRNAQGQSKELAEEKDQGRDSQAASDTNAAQDNDTDKQAEQNLQAQKPEIKEDNSLNPLLFTGENEAAAKALKVKNAHLVAKHAAQSRTLGPQTPDQMSTGVLRNPEPMRLNPDSAYLPGSVETGTHELLALQSNSNRAMKHSKRASTSHFDPEASRGSQEKTGEGAGQKKGHKSRNVPMPGHETSKDPKQAMGQDAPKTKQGAKNQQAVLTDSGPLRSTSQQPMLFAGLVGNPTASSRPAGQSQSTKTTVARDGGKSGGPAQSYQQIESPEAKQKFAAQWGVSQSAARNGQGGLQNTSILSKAAVGNSRSSNLLVGDGTQTSKEDIVDAPEMRAQIDPADPDKLKSKNIQKNNAIKLGGNGTTSTEARVMLRALELDDKAQSDLEMAAVEEYKLIGLSDFMGTNSVLDRLQLQSGQQTVAQLPMDSASNSSAARSNMPRPVNGSDGVDAIGTGGALPIASYEINSDSMPGLQITALVPGGAQDISATESEYWPYFTDVNRRITRAWGRFNQEHTYYNVQNDRAWIEVEVVLNRRGNIEGITLVRRSGTSLDQTFVSCVKSVRFRRFPRRYAPDSFTFRLLVQTTGR